MAMSKKKILVVEDEQALNNAYKIILEKAGFDVRVAFDGEQALSELKEFDPQVILLDLKMPTLDGIGFLRKYDMKKHNDKVQIVVFSNFDLQQEIDEAYGLGADKYVLKSGASPDDLVKIVKNLAG